jgi:gamma-glutamyl-gamma-aminobutyrate hydrolase PuuD
MKHNPGIFYDSSCQDVEFDDYLLLGGGTDINPIMYGQKSFGYCQSPDNRRDARNLSAIKRYTIEGKPVIGICRGLQILDAYNGGELIQHSVGHSSLVPVFVQEDGRLPDTLIDNCRSCHHQVVDHTKTTGNILGYSNYQYRAFFPDTTKWLGMLPQIVYWPDRKHLGVQFHPEWHGENHSMNVYLRSLIKEFFDLENVL